MESPALADLTRRLESLERNARHWRATALALGAALGLAVAVAAAPQAKLQQPQAGQTAEYVKARKFILTDAGVRCRLPAPSAAGFSVGRWSADGRFVQGRPKQDRNRT